MFTYWHDNSEEIGEKRPLFNALYRDFLVENIACLNKADDSLSLNELFDRKCKQHVHHHNFVDFCRC